MKVAIVGNCQATGVAQCMRIMAPGLDAIPIHYGIAPLDPDAYDMIVVQSCVIDVVTAHLAEHSPQSKISLVWPTFYFPAFHPDLVYVWANGTQVKTPLGDYSSSIAFHGWRSNLSIEQTEQLFCKEAYRHLGFFDGWEVSREMLLQDARNIGYELEEDFAAWVKTGCFAHSNNHPKLHVLASIARHMIEKLGWTVRVDHPERFLPDALALSSVWPVYPELASRFGLEGGDYIFKASWIGDFFSVTTFSLREFLEGSFAAYDTHAAADMICERVQHNEASYGSLVDVVKNSAVASANPYRGLPDYRFWRRAIAAPAAGEVDPVVRTKFALAETDRIATGGSCFAQHIARTLVRNGYNYYIAEQAPAHLTTEQAAERGFGLFSARYGNIYTARQLRQLIERAYGRYHPADSAWRRADGRWIDPFRPQLEPDGFDDPSMVEREREQHLAAVRTMFETLDLFVFTVGLTEAWCARGDGAVFPVAPGVVAVDQTADDYAFVNYTANEVRDDLELFLAALWAVNPAARVLLTVSPVPLVATFEDRHVLVSTTYSKSALRVAADEIQRRHPQVDYFPSFEIITGNFNRGAYFAEDLREVLPSGVEHVMSLFRHHFFGQSATGETRSSVAVTAEAAPVQPTGSEAAERLRHEIARGAKIICDEDLLDAPVVS